MPKTAFIVLKSPVELDPSRMMKRLSDKQDASALLLEDGIYQALQPLAAERLEKAAAEVLVCSEDLEARGFGQGDLILGRAVGYPEIVDCLMERTEKSITL